jgi:2-succinyl-5-enolpyruvyl-6-hydroxy-3-cyclohexene-1-carboxylate synthase
VVGNDGGGHIFSRLEVADEVEKPLFERLFRTRQSVDIEALANAYGWQYIKCQSLSELSEAWRLRGAVLIDYQLAD